jgi:ATP-dependent DNA helicase RecG
MDDVELEEILRVNLSTSLEIDEGREIATPDVPLAALQQLIRNAVLHRSYEGTKGPRGNYLSGRDGWPTLG